MTEKFDNYYTAEQLEKLEERKKIVGEERIRQVEGEWKELIEQVRTEMRKGTDPTSETARRLAKRWMGLIDEFTGGDPGILESLGKMYQAEPNIASDRGFTPDPEMMAYIGKAFKESE